MYLLYLDESGSITDASQKYFVLAGISCFERQTHWLSKKLDEIAAQFNPDDPSAIELHGNPMFHGKGIWRKFKTEVRIKAIIDCLELVNQSHVTNNVFVCVINKSRCHKDPIEYSFEQISSRFDMYLKRLHRRNDPHRGIIVFDKSTYESTIQGLATDFRTIGYTWGVLRNLAEVPLFLDSKASRLIQLADLIAYAAFRNYEKSDNRFFSIIKKRLDAEGGITHGMYELV
ncbi:MAG: DUF3800 domain-containing protein [Bacteroidota bacterium]|jgi:hypothetical protein